MAGVELRQLVLEDMDRAAIVHRASFDQRLPWLAGLHTQEEDRWFYRERVFPTCTVWGAIEHGRLVGIVAFREGWIDQLYVIPETQGCGIGAAQLEVARSHTDTVSLWTFQRNEGARRFYERRDFVAIRETDGSENEEREPDVLYRWVLHGRPTL